jgi:hypothetical protein
MLEDAREFWGFISCLCGKNVFVRMTLREHGGDTAAGCAGDAPQRVARTSED